MNTEQFLKSNILQKRSPKGIRGFRWQKRMFRLYHDRIVYCVIQTDIPLGEIPLVCITKIIEYPQQKKNRFNICMGSFRTFELQSTTPAIANEWIQILKSSITRYSKDEQSKMLQQQKDKFWKIDTISTEQQYNINNKFGTFNPVTQPQQPPYKQYNNQQQPYRNIQQKHDEETNSDPGTYDGYQNNISEQPVTTTTKLKDSKHKKKSKFGHHIKDKKPKKHKRGAQSNKFFGSNSKKYLKNRNKNKEMNKQKHVNKDDTTINNSSTNNEMISKTQSMYGNNKALRANHSIQRSSSANELPEINQNNNNNNNNKKKQRRLSIMTAPLASNISEYKVEEEFYTPDIESSAREPTPPFGKVAIVSYINSDKPYLLQVCNVGDRSGTIVMNRMSNLINPYIITQLQRGNSNTIEWSTYNCPSNGCLTNCLHLFRNVSITSVRILIAEIICGLEYLHTQNFNFPNLSPETIYISHKSHIILTDFGFALPNSKDYPIYRSGPLCYAPPEFLLKGVDDIKSDWWRLGVLIYHLIVGKPPFMGTRESVCQQICSQIITKETLFAQTDLDIDSNAKDLITKLITRDRKDRFGCSKPVNGHKHKLLRKKKYYGVEEIMNHPFFECIYNKKNKDYHFTWNNIRKRDHKPAQILRHLATRPTDSPRDKPNNPKTWKDVDNKMDFDDDMTDKKQDTSIKYEPEGSIIDTTDDEEEFQTDEEDEKSQQHEFQSLSKSGNNTPGGVDDYIQPNSFSNSYNNLVGSGPSSYGNNGSGPLNESSNSKSNTPLNNNANNKPFSYPKPVTNNTGLSPLPQSPPPQIHVNKALVNKNKIINKPKPASPAPIITDINNPNTPTRPITPVYESQFNIRPKGARHRKGLSSIDRVPTRALPPAPPGNNNNKSLPQLTQSQVSSSQEFGNNGLNILNENESRQNNNNNNDSRFAQYVQHQQEQMGMVLNEDLNINTPSTNNNNPQPQYGVPRLSNLHDQDEKKPSNDASTIVSDQIAAAAMWRQPILTEKQREKQKQKDMKKKKKSKKKQKYINEQHQIQMEKEKKYRHVQMDVPVTPIKSKKKSNMGNAITKKIRSKVSKKKRRFIDKVNGFNLDLTYITKRIIAMGFPSEGREEMYRNPTKEVKRFFNTYHHKKFKVYNLCIEKDRQYPDSKFTDIGGLVGRYQFKDHNSPDLELVLAFCDDLHEWLGKDKTNVAAIHCKAGKGRTGVMICAYLAYSKICKDSKDALEKYGLARTKNAKGVTIPSQRRWVLYFINYVMNPKICPHPSRFAFYQICILKRVRMITFPDFDMGGGCDPYFLILNTKGHVLYDYSQHNPVKPQRSKKRKKKKGKAWKSGVNTPTLSTTGNMPSEDISQLDIVKFRGLDIILRGAFKIVFYDKDVLSADDKMCWCWLHSAIVAREKKIFLDRENIDGAVKDKAYKHFSKDFALEFEFDTPVDEVNEKVIEPNLHEWMQQPSNSFRNNNNNNNNNGPSVNVPGQKRNSALMNNRNNLVNANNNNISSQKRHSTMMNRPAVNNNNNNNNNNMNKMGGGNYNIKPKPKGHGQNRLGFGTISSQKRHSTMSSGVDTKKSAFQMNKNTQNRPIPQNNTNNNGRSNNGRNNSNPNVPAFGNNNTGQNQNNNQQFNNQYGGRNNVNNGYNNQNQYGNRGQNPNPNPNPNQNQNQNRGQYNQNNSNNYGNNQRQNQYENNGNNYGNNNYNNQRQNQYVNNVNSNQYNPQNNNNNNQYGNNNNNNNNYRPNNMNRNQYNQNPNPNPNNQYNQNNQYNNQNQNNQYNNTYNNQNNQYQNNNNQQNNTYNNNTQYNNNNQYNNNPQYNNQNNNQYNNNQNNSQNNNANNNQNDEASPQPSDSYAINNNTYYTNNRPKNIDNFQGHHEQNQHYGNDINNNKPIQPPSISVNTQMMDTLRQNMQHHLDNTNDEAQRKNTLV